jgi:LAS superfamily LD-carboxypeptidase LdcB
MGKPMRPDVARAFDRMAAAARLAGVYLIITSGYRSDAEQARLFAAQPAPELFRPPTASNGREPDAFVGQRPEPRCCVPFLQRASFG